MLEGGLDMLSPEIQTEILFLHFSKKMKIRAIARSLGINRKSVEKVLHRRSVALSMTPSRRASILDSYKTSIALLMKESPKIPAVVVLQRIREEGYTGGYCIVKHWVRDQRVLT